MLHNPNIVIQLVQLLIQHKSKYSKFQIQTAFILRKVYNYINWVQ